MSIMALNQSVMGIMNSQNNFARSANTFINSFTPVLGAASGEAGAVAQLSQLPQQGQNPFEGMGNISGKTIVASAMGNLFSADATDPAASLVSMMMAQTGFSANLSAFASIDETQQSLLDIIA